MSTQSHTFEAAGVAVAFSLQPGQSATYAVVEGSGGYTGLISLDKSTDLLSWKRIHQGTDGEEYTGTFKNETLGTYWLRFVAADVDGETPFADDATASFTDATSEALQTFGVLTITEAGISVPDVIASTMTVGAATVTGAAAFTGTVAVDDVFTVGYVSLTPDDADGAGINVVPAGAISVSVGANVNGVNDWITLPSLASVPIGHCITIVSNAAGHEVRTPATSAEEINSEDCDGTKEYAIAAGGQIHRFTKIDNTIGWMGQGFTAIGAAVAAVVPD